MTWNHKSEVGVKLPENITPEIYWSENFDMDTLKTLAELVCEKFNIPVPRFEKVGKNRAFAGEYNYRKSIIRLAYQSASVVLHELAHHIHYLEEGRIPRHSKSLRTAWHNKRFKEILSNLWTEFGELVFPTNKD